LEGQKGKLRPKNLIVAIIIQTKAFKIIFVPYIQILIVNWLLISDGKLALTFEYLAKRANKQNLKSLCLLRLVQIRLNKLDTA